MKGTPFAAMISERLRASIVLLQVLCFSNSLPHNYKPHRLGMSDPSLPCPLLIYSIILRLSLSSFETRVLANFTILTKQFVVFGCTWPKISSRNFVKALRSLLEETEQVEGSVASTIARQKGDMEQGAEEVQRNRLKKVCSLYLSESLCSRTQHLQETPV